MNDHKPTARLDDARTVAAVIAAVEAYLEAEARGASAGPGAGGHEPMEGRPVGGHEGLRAPCRGALATALTVPPQPADRALFL